jgi:LuxR family maltose regulon positive regulatory protein
VPRRRLLAALDDDAALRVLRGGRGSGKTTLLAQWVATLDPERAVVWVTLYTPVRTRAGFWTRILTELHRRTLIDDATLYREVAGIADSPADALTSVGRALVSAGRAVDLVIDDFGGPDEPWGDVSRDVVDLVGRVPSLRCTVAGSFPTPLEGPAAAAAVRTRVLRDAELALSPEEAREMSVAAPARLEPGAVDSVVASEAARPVSELRHLLEVLAEAGGPLSAEDVDALLPSALREDVAARVGDSAVLEHLGALAQAPYVDGALAARIVGTEDAGSLLALLDRSALGSWSGDDPPVFRLSERVRTVMGAHFAAAHPPRARAVQAEVARWLEVRGDDPAVVVEYALRAGDLAYAEHLVVRTLPTLLEDPDRLGGVLAAMPVSRIRRHPFLAVLYAMALNARPGGQDRAASVLTAVATAASARMPSAPRAERGVLYGLETEVWRLLGQRPRMLDTARRAVRELTAAHDEPAGGAAAELGTAFVFAASQAATSLTFGDDLAGAREAFDLMSTIAAEQRRQPYADLAACGRAMIDVLDGRIDRARAELASVDPASWPGAWLNGYAGSLRNVAQAWVHIDDGDPAAAVEELELLAPHFDTIEHWEFIATPKAVALAMLGRAGEAEAWLEQLALERVGPRTLASVQRRLMAARSMLQLASGAAREWPERRVRGRASAVAGAMQALAAAARGSASDAVALLAGGESDVLSPLQQALVAVAGVTVAQRTTAPLDATPFGLRLATLATAHGLHWPVTLLAERDRALLLAALGTDAGDRTGLTLGHTFRTVPAIVDERLWSTPPVATLTPRERDVLRVLARTDNRSEIAAELFVSVNTVKAQLRSLYAKLDARSRDEALRRAIASGLLGEGRPSAGSTAEPGGRTR